MKLSRRISNLRSVTVAARLTPRSRHDKASVAIRAIGVFEVFDVGSAVLRPQDRHHVETCRAMRSGCFVQKKPSGLELASALSVGYGVLGVLCVVGRAGLDLDEHDGFLIGADQIDFARGAAVVSGDDAQAAALQVARRGPFASTPQRLPTVKTPQPTQAWQTPSYDGCEVHEPCGPCRSGNADSTAWRDGPCPAGGPLRRPRWVNGA